MHKKGKSHERKKKNLADSHYAQKGGKGYAMRSLQDREKERAYSRKVTDAEKSIEEKAIEKGRKVLRARLESITSTERSSENTC